MESLLEYNDYVLNTKNYLRNLDRFKATAANKREQAEMWKSELSIDVPIAKYSGMPGGGTGDLTSTESAAAHREDKKKRISTALKEAERLDHIVSMVERSINLLSTEDRLIIEMRFREHKSWMQIGDELNYSEKWTARKGNRAVKAIARMLFGDVAFPGQQELFVFAI